MAEHYTSVADYIDSFPEEVQLILDRIRRTMHEAVPGADEAIKYQMPTITLNDRSVVHFAGWKRHIGLYPIPAGDEAFEQELAPYNTGTGTARFPLNKPIPYDLIGRLTALLVEQRAANPD